jgi:anthranilate phosphoribosyltransferase
MIQSAVAKLVDRKSLTFLEAQQAVTEIFSGQATAAQVAGFLVGLRMKGETPEEIAGCAEAMRTAATRIHLSAPVIVDTCGTGGDGQGGFNVSTAAAFVVAGAGFTVAKHGNRSISSHCGSADVLEALGVKVDAPVAVVERCLKEVGIGFLFAPAFHPAMKHAMPVRRELAIRTVFNLLGPLCNPAGANVQVIGVFSARHLDVMAKVLVRLGTRHSLVVHSAGYDEITLSGPTLAVEIVEGRLKKRRFLPKDFGLKACPKAALQGGDKEENAEILRRIFRGEKGPQRDVVVANAAAAILVAGRAGGESKLRNLKDAVRVAEHALDSGAASERLRLLSETSQQAG